LGHRKRGRNCTDRTLRAHLKDVEAAAQQEIYSATQERDSARAAANDEVRQYQSMSASTSAMKDAAQAAINELARRASAQESEILLAMAVEEQTCENWRYEAEVSEASAAQLRRGPGAEV